MEYENLKNIVNLKLSNFINEYRNTSELFVNEDLRNRLIHPGEFGMYKERLIKQLFEFTLPKRFTCGNGFVINNNKEITTQCDIILYDDMNAPFLENSTNNRFFPQEVVYAIGEIKSKITKRQLLDTAIKLANNKSIRSTFKNIDNKDINPENNPYEAIFTFIICDEIIGWHNDIALDIQTEYVKHSISKPCWFNIIVSLKNGVIAYDVYKSVQLLEQMGKSVDSGIKENDGHAWIAVPFMGNMNQIFIPLDFTTIVLANELEHMKQFIVLMNEVLIHHKAYYPDPKYYLYI